MGYWTISQTPTLHEQVAATLKTVRKIRDSQKEMPGGNAIRLGYSEKKLAAIARYEKALAQEFAIAFSETPLVDALEYLSTGADYPIQLDIKALDELGIDSDHPVSITLRGVTLRSALRHLLRTIDPTLTFHFANEVLMVTTADTACENLGTMIYPVADLVSGGGHSFNYDALIELFATTIQPDSWDEVGGPASAAAFSPSRALIVSQTDEAHYEIKSLLAQLRKINLKTDRAPKAAAASPEIDLQDAYITAVYHLTKPKEGKAAAKEQPALEDKLVELVRSMVDASSWQKQPAAAIQAIPGRLVIRQRIDVHKEIYKMLLALDVLEKLDAHYGSSRGFF